MGFAVGALVVSACGSGTSTSTSGFQVSTVAQGTEQARTAHYAGTHTWAQPGGGPQVVTEFEGEIDFDRHRTSYEGTDTNADGHTTSSNSRHLDGYSYFATANDPAPDGTQDSQPPKKPWTRSRDISSGSVTTLDVSDVPGLLANLKAGAATQEQLGRDSVRGVATEHYRYTSPARHAPSQLEAMGSFRSVKTTWEVWVDDQQRLRRISDSSDAPSTGVGPNSFGPEHSVTEFFDFGAPVSIEAPPADQVMDEPSQQLTGDWKVVQHGRSDDVAWQVFRAPSQDVECFSHEADPPSEYDLHILEQRGHRVEKCSMPLTPSMGGLPALDFEDVTVNAAALANGKVLLFGGTGSKTRSLTLYYRGGRVEHIVPTDASFAVVLAGNEVVERIVPIAPNQDINCPLDPKIGDYNCSGSMGPQGPPVDGLLLPTTTPHS
ncbi:MAG: hypothetical protein ACXVKA_12405 [Acidimicrobiia bacterium]